MNEYTVDQANDGRRLDRYLKQTIPNLSVSHMQKYMRLKQITVNEKRVTPNARVAVGDVVRVFAQIDTAPPAIKRDGLLSTFRWQLQIVYEDEHVLIADKRVGLLVHPDEQEKVNTLTTHVRAYLYQKGAYDATDATAFAPTPVNRIDRFTGGIVLFAKTKDALHELNRMIRAHEIRKEYLLLVQGAPQPAQGTIDNYIVKSEKARRVRVSRKPEPGAQRAITQYRTISCKQGVSLVACTLITGRTHQIRAQFADMGHPLAGDTQYGDKAFNERLHMSAQALYAYRVTFGTGTGVLTGVYAKTFTVARVPFAPDIPSL